MPPYVQPFNTLDTFELGVHELLQAIGQPGLKLQGHLWLGGSLDVDGLRSAVDRLARVHPVAAARLDRNGRRARWRAGEGGSCPLEIHPLDSDDDAAVWREAERLLAERSDPVHQPPLTFHLLRRPTAGDTLVVEWVHALMDGKAGELLLCELNRLHAATELPPPAPPLLENETRRHLRSFPWHKRWRAFRGVIRGRMRRPPVLLMRHADTSRWVPGPMRLTGRVLDEKRTAAVLQRARKLCGFPNLVPPLLASAYRALGRYSPEAGQGEYIYHAPVPVNLRPPGARRPIFRNLMSYVGLQAEAAELDDRDELTRRLSRRMREQFSRHSDLGALMAMSFAARSSGLKRRMQRKPRVKISLGFAYQGAMPEELERFCDVPVEREFFMTSLPAPPGLGITVNQCRKRLNVSMTYVSEVIPEALAESFLDGMITDLTE